MIARIWTGKTPIEKGAQYKTFLLEVAVPDYRSVETLLGIDFLYREEGSTAVFTLITYWPSVNDIKRFAGEDFELARYYPEDREYLLEFPERVTHHEVFFHLPVRASGHSPF